MIKFPLQFTQTGFRLTNQQDRDSLNEYCNRRKNKKGFVIILEENETYRLTLDKSKQLKSYKFNPCIETDNNV